MTNVITNTGVLKDSPTDLYQRRVLEDPLLPIKNFPTFMQNQFGIPEELYSPAVLDVRSKLETFVSSLGFGDYVSTRNRQDVISEAQRRGVKVISATEGGALQALLYDAFSRAITENETDSIICIKIILYYINAYSTKLFSSGMRFAFIDELRKTGPEKTVFTNLMHLFVATCNPALAQRNVKRIDFNRIKTSLSTEHERDNLTRAYADYFLQ